MKADYKTTGEKKCIECEMVLNVSLFYEQGGIHKGSGRLFSRCKSCHNSRLVQIRSCDPEQKQSQKLRRAAWSKRHPLKQKESFAICFARLTDGVVANMMGMKKNDAPLPLINCKRELIKLNRILNDEQNK